MNHSPAPLDSGHPAARRSLFVYGTLLDDALVTELTGRRFRKEAAVLPGYRKLLPKGGYPYVVTDATGAVDGFLLHDVDAAALRALDRYEDEGRLYRRMPVVVDVGGRPQHAMTYAGIPEALTPSASAG